MLLQCRGQARPTDRSAAARYLKEAIRYGRQAIKGGAGADITTILINASYLREDYASTARLEQARVDSEVQQGMAPGAEQLDMLRSAYFKMNGRRALLNAFKTRLTFHPTPELWAQVVGLIAAAAATQPVSTLHVYRLMLEGNILRRPVDYTEYANLALRSGLVGEARAVLEKGFADHVFPSGAQDTNRSLLDSATAQAVVQQASLASLAEQAQAERRVDVLQAAAFGYFGCQDYHTAAALLRQALATGGLKKRNEADARLLLGIAQWRIGQPRAALDSFALVSADPVLGPIADLWAAHVVSAASAVRPPPPPVPARSFPMPVVTPL